MKKTWMVLAVLFGLFTASSSFAADPLWVGFFDGNASGTDKSVAIRTGDGNHVYVTGQSDGNGSGLDMVTIRYAASGPDSQGDPEWVARYDGPASLDDVPVAMVVDGLGNVFVTGSSVGEGTSVDIVTVKYDKAGVLQWETRYNGPDGGADLPAAIALDPFSRWVYVTGSITGKSGSKNIVTIKYDAATGEIPRTGWPQVYRGPVSGSDDTGRCLAVDEDGNAYVGGTIHGAMATLRYDAAGGNPSWVQRRVGRTKTNNQVRAIAVDGNRDVIVTGDSDEKMVTIKYKKSGRPFWAKPYRGRNRNPDAGFFLALNGAGDVYVTGQSEGDIVVFKYASRAGAQKWVYRFTKPNTTAKPAGMALDATGNVYVAASRSSAEDVSSIVTFSLADQKGAERWVNQFDREVFSVDVATGIALDAESNVCVSGYSSAPGASVDYTTLKYPSQSQ